MCAISRCPRWWRRRAGIGRFERGSGKFARVVKSGGAGCGTTPGVKAETQSFYEAAVLRTVVQISRTLDQALDLAALARGAALSPFHFHRVFRGMVGETPLEMHRRLRLERAARALLTSDAAVTAIAFDAGYETHEAFTRAFRQAYGVPPSAFRQGVPDPRTGCVRPPQAELAAPSGVHYCDDPTRELHVHIATKESIMQVDIETRPALRVATVTHIGPYNRISEAFARLGALAGPAGLFASPAAAMVAIYYDEPEVTPPEQLRSDAGLVVPEGVPLPAGLGEQRLPAGRYARTTHIGPYTELGDAWSRLMGGWLPRSGQRVGEGHSYEVYRNDPTNTPPERLHTELYLPLA
ncbi:AraC family transcriptional regulator [Nannocystis exedens]|uniref:AraC family transcriptional regulator n=1 Tax=Nannocystis exedens TaxID=54 RepID=A0A1I2HHG1_9BACT|nr:Transposon Tn10 TetD protein [Nannocystis exedens]SFF29584.1 AraC family transcriptional regulator [Nannocystis exedens]